uniref:Uncharacterized protein n=1 Tax=Plectus sambesii TaxID=2011161 RepID=A0A914X9W4_9BILA
MRLIHADSLANKENMEEREMAQETQMYDQMEDALCKDAVVRDLPDGEVWAAVESLRSQRLWRPIRRAPDDLEDPDRVVLYDDVKSCLIELADADNRRRLLIESLMMLGARFPDETSVNDVTTLCTDFDKLPRLDNRLIGMESLGMRLFEVAQQLYPVNKEATYFACAQLVYAADSLTTRTDLRPKDRSKQFKKMAKELMEKRPRDCWPLYATYAEQLARLGDETGAAQVAQKTLAMCAAEKSVWQLANTSEQLPVLRLLTVFLAGQDLQYYPALLADIGLYGRLQTATSSAAHLVKAKAAWLEKVASLASDKDVESDWQGCSLSLAASLCARFVYTVAIGRDKLRAALAVFEHTLQALTGASKVSKRERERLTKVKIDLIDDYLNSDPTAPPRLLRDALEQAVIEFPDNTDFLKRFIDLNLRGHALVGLRRFFDQRSSDHPLVVRSVGAVYAELARYISLVEAADDAFALPEIHRIRAVLDRCAERHPETAVFWRFRAHFEQLRGDKNAVLQVFYRAVRQCPYEKALFLDCARAYPQKASMLVDLMIEKGLRLRCPIEEVDILREAAGGQKRVIEDSDDDSSSDGEK